MLCTKGHVTRWHTHRIYWRGIYWGKLVDLDQSRGVQAPSAHCNYNGAQRSRILHSKRAPRPLNCEFSFNYVIREVLTPPLMQLGLGYNYQEEENLALALFPGSEFVAGEKGHQLFSWCDWGLRFQLCSCSCRKC